MPLFCMFNNDNNTRLHVSDQEIVQLGHQYLNKKSPFGEEGTCNYGVTVAVAVSVAGAVVLVAALPVDVGPLPPTTT